MHKLLSRYLATAVVLFCLWLLLTSTVEAQELVAGAVIALLVAGLSCRDFTARGLRILSPRRLLHLSIYLPVFF